jgi:hypothetical protein
MVGSFRASHPDLGVLRLLLAPSQSLSPFRFPTENCVPEALVEHYERVEQFILRSGGRRAESMNSDSVRLHSRNAIACLGEEYWLVPRPEENGFCSMQVPVQVVDGNLPVTNVSHGLQAVKPIPRGQLR